MEAAQASGQFCDLSLRSKSYSANAELARKMYTLLPEMRHMADVTSSFNFERNMKALLQTKLKDQAFSIVMDSMAKEQI